MKFPYKKFLLFLIISSYIPAYAVDDNKQSHIQEQGGISNAKELDRLEAEISKLQDEYKKSPKRKYIGNATKDKRYAIYVNKWWRKVQKIGNLNYPQAAKNLELSGAVILTVSILPDGSIERIDVNRSSGHKILDNAAIDIAKLASPFEAFTPEMKKDADILSITRTWTFTHIDDLELKSDESQL